jgi:hypothetical protein
MLKRMWNSLIGFDFISLLLNRVFIVPLGSKVLLSILHVTVVLALESMRILNFINDRLIGVFKKAQMQAGWCISWVAYF